MRKSRSNMYSPGRFRDFINKLQAHSLDVSNLDQFFDFANKAAELSEVKDTLKVLNAKLYLMKQALKKSESQYLSIYENAPFGYLNINADKGSILGSNRSARILLGYDTDELKQLRFYDLFHRSKINILKARKLLMLFKKGHLVRDNELQMKHSDGTPIWINLSIEPIKDPNGRVIIGRSIFYDISKWKKVDGVQNEQKLDSMKHIRDLVYLQEVLGIDHNVIGKLLNYISTQVRKAREEERKRIAFELHDGIGQNLSAIKYRLEAVIRGMDKETLLWVHKNLESIIYIVQKSIKEIRDIHLNPRPPTLDELGILKAIRLLCWEFEKIYKDKKVNVCYNIKENEIPDELKDVIFKIVQEALNNIAKHARADVVQLLMMKKDHKIELSVRDNGIGFNIVKNYAGSGRNNCFGISILKERARLSGGNFSIRSIKGSGTRIKTTWPVSDTSGDP